MPPQQRRPCRTTVADAQAELGRTLSALTEARSVAERQTDVAEAEQIIAPLARNSPAQLESVLSYFDDNSLTGSNQFAYWLMRLRAESQQGAVHFESEAVS